MIADQPALMRIKVADLHDLLREASSQRAKPPRKADVKPRAKAARKAAVKRAVKPGAKSPRKAAVKRAAKPAGPVPPAGLSVRAESFWRKSLADFELSDGELEVLTEVAWLLSEIDGLRAALTDDGLTVEGASGQVRTHPALSQVRQHRTVLARLIKELHLPAVDEEPDSITSQDARAAANARWDPSRRRRHGT